MIKSVEYLDSLSKELKGFSDHWKAVNSQNSEPSILPDKKGLRFWKEKLPFLKKLQEILKKKSYTDLKDVVKYFWTNQRFLPFSNKIGALLCERATDQLRKAKTICEIEEIENFVTNQSEYKEYANKLNSFSEEEQEEFVRNFYFLTSKNEQHWSEILRVTKCEHCNYRYIFTIDTNREREKKKREKKRERERVNERKIER